MKRALLVLVPLCGCLSTPSAPDGPTHRWRELAGASEPGKLHSARMTFDESRKSVVMHGGVMAGSAIQTTWQLTDGDTWTEICPSADLPALYAPAFAYDPVGEQLVLAGGSTTDNFRSPTGEVWTCSSKTAMSTWVHHSVALPAAVVGAQMVHDGTRLILVGGNDDMNMYRRQSLTTTDLQTWEPHVVVSPSTFGGASTNITYDARNGRILALKNYTSAFGGSTEATNELWQLPKNAGNWSLICGPSAHGCGWEARYEASLAYFEETDSAFAIGGTGGSPKTEFAGSWILDNNELIHSDDNPPARDRAAMIYDREHKRLVVYGGNGRGCSGDCGTTWVLEAE